MAFDRAVFFDVCRKTGHQFVSYLMEVVRDPRSGEHFPQHKVFCSRCGATTDEAASDVRNTVGKRRKKTAIAPAAPAEAAPVPAAATAPASATAAAGAGMPPPPPLQRTLGDGLDD